MEAGCVYNEDRQVWEWQRAITMSTPIAGSYQHGGPTIVVKIGKTHFSHDLPAPNQWLKLKLVGTKSNAAP